jgi:hypothetical protein
LVVRVGEGDSGVCVAELVAALSLGTDLGLGQPMEHVLRMCVLALGLADRLGLDGVGGLLRGLVRAGEVVRR